MLRQKESTRAEEKKKVKKSKKERNFFFFFSLPKQTSFWPLFWSPQAVPVLYLNCSHQEPQPEYGFYRGKREKSRWEETKLSLTPPQKLRERGGGER